MTENQGIFTLGGVVVSIAVGCMTMVEWGFVGVGVSIMLAILGRKWIG